MNGEWIPLIGAAISLATLLVLVGRWSGTREEDLHHLRRDLERLEKELRAERIANAEMRRGHAERANNHELRLDRLERSSV